MLPFGKGLKFHNSLNYRWSPGKRAQGSDIYDTKGMLGYLLRMQNLY